MAGESGAQHGDAKIVRTEAGVDWVTWVAPAGRDAAPVRALARDLVDAQRRATGRSREFRAHGYEGESCHGIAWGDRTDSLYLRLSGTLAAQKWGLLASCAGHPTRVDLQTTNWFTSSRTNLGRQSMRISRRTSGPPLGRRVTRTYQADTRGLYIGRVGARTSPKHGRVYDKGHESGEAPNGTCWRWEVELKQHEAKHIWNCLTETEDTATLCYGACASAWRLWGLSWCLPSATSVVAFAPAVPKMPLPVSASLRWLAKQVRPTIERLVGIVGTETLLTALGLDAYAMPIGWSRESLSGEHMETLSSVELARYDAVGALAS